MCGISAPNASVGKMIESTAAPAMLDPLALKSQLPFSLKNVAQSTSAAAENAHADAIAIFAAAGLSR